MKQVASANITGFVESSSDKEGEVVVAGIRFKVANTEDLDDGDLIALSATLDESGSWNGTITMHLGRPPGLTAVSPENKVQQRPAAVASTQPRLQPAPAASMPGRAALSPIASPASPTTNPSRSQRFGQSSQRSAPAAAPVPPAATAAPKTRPTFNIDEDVDLDIPF